MSDGGLRSNATVIAAVITALGAIAAAIITAPWWSTWGDPGGGGSGGGTQKTDYSNKEGLYTGESTDHTEGRTYVASLNLRSIDSNTGNVDEAYVDFWANTSGDSADDSAEGDLYGTIAEDGEMELAGDVSGGPDGQFKWDSKLDCQFTRPEAIECNWTLEADPDNPLGDRDGTFSLTKS